MPVTFYLAGRPGGIQWVVAAFVVSTDFNAMAAIAQGRSGVDVRGVMSLFHKNMLAGSFLVPLFLALGDSMHNPARPWRVAARVSTLLIAAGLWYAVSRGAIVGALAGLVAYVCLSPKGWRFAAAGLALIAILAVVRPDFGASSGIMERFTDIGHGAESENLPGACTSDGRTSSTSWNIIRSSASGRPPTTPLGRTPTRRTTATLPSWCNPGSRRPCATSSSW